VGEASARPPGLERALTRAGFHLVEREDPAADPEADAILITLTQIDDDPLSDLLPTPGSNRAIPRIVLVSAPSRDAPAAALALGAADAMAAPIHLPELCARLYARIRDRTQFDALRHLEPIPSPSEAATAALTDLDPDEVALTVVRRLVRAFDLAHCSFVSIGPGGDQGRIVAEVENPVSVQKHFELARHPEVAEAIRTRKVVVQPVHANHPSEPPRTLVVLPISTGDRISGTLLLRTRDPHRRFTSLELEFAAGLARTAAMALETGQVASNGREPLEATNLLGSETALDHRVKQEFERARRYSLSFSLILLAVDAKGAEEGRAIDGTDRLRREVGLLLRRELRLPDFIAPYGREEFAVVLPETGQFGARQSVIRVRERLATLPFEGEHRTDRARFSAGIVTFPHPAAFQSDDLFAMAEAALMRGKAQVGERIGEAV
jgi:diguanylate cyclase (GGDEF)-like protein